MKLVYILLSLLLISCGGGGGSDNKAPVPIVDSDDDGVPDSSDAFPNDANETNDSDSDGIGDNGDAFPNDQNESIDSDGDGIGDNGDAFPNNPFESKDENNDGVGDKYTALFSDGVKAVHVGGNWGTNTSYINSLPQEYFDYLKELNVNWVGISVALHYENSMDSSVERKYDSVEITTFEDSALVNFINKCKAEGFHVYLTLAFEALEAENDNDMPAPRWILGDPNGANELSEIKQENWPWDIEHQDHTTFISDFWQSYTAQAVHFAELAQASGVELFSLGTETDRLFRSRAGDGWPNDFSTNIQTMVSEVKDVYDGLISYDMGYHTTTATDFYGIGSNNLWQDSNLDVVGVSAYYPLVNSSPTQVLSVEELETYWRNIFDNYLVPLRNKNPLKPILFLEFGYVDSINSAFEPASEAFITKVLIDNNSNNLDDGEEAQRNILQAFYQVRAEYPDVISGTFLWDNYISDAEGWDNSFGKLRSFSFRDKLSEELIKNTYKNWDN